MIVNRCGINFTHDKNFQVDQPTGTGDYLFIYTKTKAVFVINNEPVVTPNNIIFLYKKNSLQNFHAYEDIYINDFIHFNTASKEDELFIDSLNLIYNQPLKLSIIYSFMNVQQQITIEHQNNTKWSEKSIDLLLHYFLIKLSESMSFSKTKYDSKVLDTFSILRTKIYREPNIKWTVNIMAEFVNFSPSYFQNIYHQLFNTSCLSDVIIARIEMAKNMLAMTNYTSREIASNCGYENDTHFSRQFKAVTGMTAQEYRKEQKEAVSK